MEKNCEYCGYKWTSRKKDPKACPRCKRRTDYLVTDISAVKLKEKQLDI